MSFIKDLVKSSGNEYANIVSEGVAAGDVDTFVDTGSYVFNALLSGSLYGGLPKNKITAIAGESATGKTFFLMGIVKNFLDKNPDAGVLYFESESAITKQMIIDSAAEDILYTDYFTGVHGNYLRGSIRAQGLDPNNLPDRKSGLDYSSGQSKPKSWKQIWGAGQGIGVIENTRPATEFIDQLRTEYHQAVEQLSK